MLVLLLVLAYVVAANDPCTGPASADLLYQCSVPSPASPALHAPTPVDRMEAAELGILQPSRWRVENRGPLPLIGGQ